MRKLLALTILAACGGPAENQNPNELITTVTLTFTPGDLVFAFDDPDGDGGESPTVDPIELAAGDYTVAVAFENRLEDPPEDITEEVADESDEHQVFFTGDAPLAIAYADEDANGLPIGLAATVTATAGTGALTVTLRHLPPINDVATKTADLAQEVEDNGLTGIPGESDAHVTFEVTVP